ALVNNFLSSWPCCFVPAHTYLAGKSRFFRLTNTFESLVFQTARWSALLLGVFYGKQRFEYLKPIAEEERRVEEAEKKAREEQERIYKQLSEANSDTILK
uniref:ATP synthase F(0) complex subunit e, mitochondrial n=1 Tax=Amphiprion ocellaris TaxID=80972 RepID=A0AAQ6ACZ3_AMPOC